MYTPETKSTFRKNLTRRARGLASTSARGPALIFVGTRALPLEITLIEYHHLHLPLAESCFTFAPPYRRRPFFSLESLRFSEACRRHITSIANCNLLVMSGKGPVKQLARKATKCSRKTEPNRYELKSDEEDSDTGQSSSAGTGIRSTVPAKAQHSTSIRKSVRSERDAGLYSSQVGPSRRLGNNLHRSTEHTAHLAPPMGHKARNPAKPAVTLPSLFHTAPGAPTLRVSQRKAASTIFNRLQVVFTPMTEVSICWVSGSLAHHALSGPPESALSAQASHTISSKGEEQDGC